MMQCHCSDEMPCAKKISIFSQLDHESLLRISALAKHLTFQKGELLFSPSQTEGLFLISEGRVKVYEISSSGKEELLRVLNAGDFVGEEALFSADETFSFGEALGTVHACFIKREAFLQLLLDYPSISLKLLEEYSRRMIRASHQATANMSESVMSRLAAYLLELSSAEESAGFTLPMQMKELSNFLSTSPETLSRRVKQLVNEGLIEKSGRKITILDADGLRNLSV